MSRRRRLYARALLYTKAGFVFIRKQAFHTGLLPIGWDFKLGVGIFGLTSIIFRCISPHLRSSAGQSQMSALLQGLLSPQRYFR